MAENVCRVCGEPIVQRGGRWEHDGLPRSGKPYSHDARPELGVES